MGLAGFNRARRRLVDEGAALAVAPKPKFVKQDITIKQYCAYCDKHFQNVAAYEKHMMYKHTEDWVANNPDKELPLALQKKLNIKE